MSIHDNGNRLAFIRERLPVALVHNWLDKYLAFKVHHIWIGRLEQCIASGVNYGTQSTRIPATVAWLVQSLGVNMAFCEQHGQVYGEGSACPYCTQEKQQEEIAESSEE